MPWAHVNMFMPFRAGHVLGLRMST